MKVVSLKISTGTDFGDKIFVKKYISLNVGSVNVVFDEIRSSDVGVLSRIVNNRKFIIGNKYMIRFDKDVVLLYSDRKDKQLKIDFVFDRNNGRIIFEYDEYFNDIIQSLNPVKVKVNIRNGVVESVEPKLVSSDVQNIDVGTFRFWNYYRKLIENDNFCGCPVCSVSVSGYVSSPLVSIEPGSVIIRRLIKKHQTINRYNFVKPFDLCNFIKDIYGIHKNGIIKGIEEFPSFFLWTLIRNKLYTPIGVFNVQSIRYGKRKRVVSDKNDVEYNLSKKKGEIMLFDVGHIIVYRKSNRDLYGYLTGVFNYDELVYVEVNNIFRNNDLLRHISDIEFIMDTNYNYSRVTKILDEKLLVQTINTIEQL